jgi:hypothetical protein
MNDVVSSSQAIATNSSFFSGTSLHPATIRIGSFRRVEIEPKLLQPFLYCVRICNGAYG